MTFFVHGDFTRNCGRTVTEVASDNWSQKNLKAPMHILM